MDKPKNYLEVLRWASSFLEEAGKEGYAAEYLLLGRLNWNKTQWLLHMHEPIPEAVEAQLRSDVEQVAQDQPPQYLLGECEFYGRKFFVTPDTLIPRPETEELVALCLAKNTSEPIQIIDIGTGTGAIAVSLKSERSNWQVCAVDISEGALEVAKKNANAQAAPVDFYLGDLFSPFRNQETQFDVIISNPPYIGVEEWAEMDESVRKFEPKQALYAENHGLAIYQELAKQSPKFLKPTGKIFLEIGYLQGAAVRELFSEAFPEKTVSIHQDLSGQDRMIVVE